MKSFFESPIFIFLFFAFILVNYILALWFQLYYFFWWLDIVHHLFGGILIVAAFNFFIIRQKTALFGFNPLLIFLIFLGIVALAGILWEFGEFIWNRYIWYSGYNLPNIYATYEDTLSDLFFDLFGGVIGFSLIL